MSRISRNISIIIRSERLIAQRHLAVLRQQTIMIAAAGIAAGVGLIMLNVSAYLALSDIVSQSAAALIVAVVNVVLAGILIAVAGKSNVEQETAPVAEVRDMALEDLEAEILSAAAEAKAATDALRQMAKNPLGTIAPGLAGTVVSAVVKNLKN
ncbi:phage holin family protein [Pelagimonas varians]|uniref:Holin-X, holin superfamily III n=1 Tax=Pelagimonas varians TaxID=696760 RepID=A0A238KWB6_9RHOB|nr:phage holin family protein [Pelagimonas varians]PYG28004.1 putative superfamily III holin-X [Pelagimonas varians]SMX47079.1 hypothetical protein PEV8663_03466 [Pelagimonas varians]